MAFKVFLSYGMDPDAQVTAWRLQTLATSYGIHVSVPQRNGAKSTQRSTALSDQVRHSIDQADCVLAFLTGRSGPAVERELNYALQKRKLIIPIVQEGAGDSSFLKKFPRVFRFSPGGDAGKVEHDVVDFLKQHERNKVNQQSIGALVLLGLGLFLLVALSEK